MRELKVQIRNSGSHDLSSAGSRVAHPLAMLMPINNFLDRFERNYQFGGAEDPPLRFGSLISDTHGPRCPTVGAWLIRIEIEGAGDEVFMWS